jgi:hypothetical protein
MPRIYALDAMNTGHAAVTWLSTVGIGSIRCGDLVADGVPASGVGMSLGAAGGLCELHRMRVGFRVPRC